MFADLQVNLVITQSLVLFFYSNSLKVKIDLIFLNFDKTIEDYVFFDIKNEIFMYFLVA